MQIEIPIGTGVDAVAELSRAASPGGYMSWFGAPYRLVGEVSRETVLLRFNRTLLSGWATVAFRGGIAETPGGLVLRGKVGATSAIRWGKIIVLAIWGMGLASVLRSGFRVSTGVSMAIAAAVASLIWIGSRLVQHREERDLVRRLEDVLGSRSQPFAHSARGQT